MQSSFGHVVRAVVMLACLAVVPVIALYGKQIQEFARAVWETYQTRSHAKAGDSAGDAGGNAPPWPAPATTGQTADHTSPLGGWPNSTAAAEPQYLAAPWNQPSALPAGATNERSAQGATAPGEVQQASFTGSPSADGTGDAARAAAANLPAAYTQSASDSASGAAAHSSAGGTNCTVEFRRIEQRLRELGATYYLLDTWGRNGDRYRFLCRVALTGNTDLGADRVFFATDSDPLRAMQNVLQQVEQWRSGSSQ